MNKNARLLIALKQLNDLIEACDEESKREHRFWVNPFLVQRHAHDMEVHLMKDIMWDECEFKNFNRINVDDFEKIHRLVESQIRKEDTMMRPAISSRVRISLTLRYIATGDSYRSLEFLSHVSRKTIGKFVPEVLTAICNSLQEEYLRFPANENDWLSVADGFLKKWQFPNTLGAIDGKHIRIKSPPKSGSDFYNYKGFFSIVLLAVVDASGKFIYIDVGANGRASDVVILKNSTFYDAVNREALNIPPDKALPGQLRKTSFYFVGDDIFGLDRHLMKAYNRNSNLSTSQEIFNYRLSRARMTVEMAFGRLAARFRIFHRPIEVDLVTSDLVVNTCCILHNYLTKDIYEPSTNDLVPPELPETFAPLPTQVHEKVKYANEMRENVSKYLITDGDVPFQWKKIKKQVANPVEVTIN